MKPSRGPGLKLPLPDSFPFMKTSQTYGHLGSLSPEEWKARLGSDQGLFARIPRASRAVIGPRLGKSGHITGDLLAMETIYFTRYASTEQNKYFQELMDSNLPAAMEYMLTVSHSIRRWKNDLRVIIKALHIMEDNENLLEGEEIKVKMGKSPDIFLQKLLPPLKRHFPLLFKNVEKRTVLDQADISRIKEMEGIIKSEERYIKNYLRGMKEKMPFLFK